MPYNYENTLKGNIFFKCKLLRHLYCHHLFPQLGVLFALEVCDIGTIFIFILFHWPLVLLEHQMFRLNLTSPQIELPWLLQPKNLQSRLLCWWHMKTGPYVIEIGERHNTSTLQLEKIRFVCIQYYVDGTKNYSEQSKWFWVAGLSELIILIYKIVMW